MPENPLDLISPATLGERLKEARKSRGLTQQQVATQLDMARTTVTAIEKGERRVQPLELAKFAELYRHAVSELIRPTTMDQPLTVELRSNFGARTARNAALNPLVHELERLCEDFVELEQLNGVRAHRRFPGVYPVRSPEADAEEAALEERRRLGLGDGPILNLREVLENVVGLRIFFIEMPATIAAMFGFTEDLGGCIAVNRNHPADRRRLSLAHEYGHFLCERESSDVALVGERHRQVSSHELFANAFSFAFLMPDSGIRRRVRDITSSREGRLTVADLCQLAHSYFVSPEALCLRLESLRLLPPGTWERLRQGGFRVREAQQQLGLEPHAENDSMLPWKYLYLAAEAFGRDQISEGRLAKFLRVDRVTARDMVKELAQPEQLGEDGDLQYMQLDLGRVLTIPL